MSKEKKLILLIFTFLIFGCSFDSKTGIWSGGKDEKLRISELEQQQKELISVEKIYSTENIFSEEKSLKTKINLSKPKNLTSWPMSGLNHQNLIGNIYLTGSENIFLKKKIGKNKFSLSKINSSPLVYNNNIFISDDKGTIFNVSVNGSLNWKRNIYKKLYKKVYKNITLSIDKDYVYAADNIGFVYAIDLRDGKVIWIKNHGIPLKSKIKIYKDKVVLVNQDNRILCFNARDGSLIWDVRSISSFIKTQNFLSTALSKTGHIIVSNSSGDLIKIDLETGQVEWSLNTLGYLSKHATDFFKSSDVIIVNENIIFSNQSTFFSYNLLNGYTNWEKDISSIGTPIIDGNNIFFVTENGFFIIMDLNNGNIISSTNILSVLKKRKQSTKITGFIMGSGRIYAVTLNGYLISSSATSGKVESYKKIGDSIVSNPIISNGNLYVYTKKSKIIGLN